MKRPDLLPTTWKGKLGRLEEEMGEVMQAIGKMRRFGFIDDATGKEYNNLSELYSEIDDLIHAAKVFAAHDQKDAKL